MSIKADIEQQMFIIEQQLNNEKYFNKKDKLEDYLRVLKINFSYFDTMPKDIFVAGSVIHVKCKDCTGFQMELRIEKREDELWYTSDSETEDYLSWPKCTIDDPEMKNAVITYPLQDWFFECVTDFPHRFGAYLVEDPSGMFLSDKPSLLVYECPDQYKRCVFITDK